MRRAIVSAVGRTRFRHHARDRAPIDGFTCHALSFRYGQRHAVELAAAARVAKALGAAEHRTITIDLAAFGGSALTDHTIAVPETPTTGIPITYVPARNTIFLCVRARLG